MTRLVFFFRRQDLHCLILECEFVNFEIFHILRKDWKYNGRYLMPLLNTLEDFT